MKEVKSVLCTGTCGYKKVTDYNTTGLLNDGYAFDSTLSTCTNGATLSFDSLNNKLNVSSTSKTVCNAYFTVSKGPNLLELNTKQVAEGLQVTVASAPRGKVPVIYYYSTDNGNTYSTSTSNIYIINGLTVGTDYTFKVYAEDKDGNKSNIITKTVTKYSITNLVANGSFENGSTGWYLYSLSISSLKSKFGTYSVRNLNPSQWSAAHNYAETVTAAPSVTVGHNYYGSSWIITISRGNGYCYNDAGFYYDSTYHWMGMGGIQTSYNMWEKKSSIFLVPNVSNPFLNYGFAAYSGSDKIGECYADGAFLIDLTSTFGSGNEPSKEWLDNNIDYIDGTSSIYYMR